jgi:hypothetical protein
LRRSACRQRAATEGKPGNQKKGDPRIAFFHGSAGGLLAFAVRRLGGPALFAHRFLALGASFLLLGLAVSLGSLLFFLVGSLGVGLASLVFVARGLVVNAPVVCGEVWGAGVICAKAADAANVAATARAVFRRCSIMVELLLLQKHGMDGPHKRRAKHPK